MPGRVARPARLFPEFCPARKRERGIRFTQVPTVPLLQLANWRWATARCWLPEREAVPGGNVSGARNRLTVKRDSYSMRGSSPCRLASVRNRATPTPRLRSQNRPDLYPPAGRVEAPAIPFLTACGHDDSLQPGGPRRPIAHASH